MKVTIEKLPQVRDYTELERMARTPPVAFLISSSGHQMVATNFEELMTVLRKEFAR